MKIKLKVLLGLNCNIACRHCLNSSRPGRRDFDVSESEVQSLVSLITTDLRIDEVAFSGGEPLLYLDSIEAILEARSQEGPLKTSITTNGLLLKKERERLEELKIDSCLLSVDSFHEEQVPSEELPTTYSEAVSLAKQLFGKK